MSRTLLAGRAAGIMGSVTEAEVGVGLPERVRDALLGTAPPRCAQVYDRTALRDRAAHLREVLPPGATLLHTVRANANPDVLDSLATVVDGFVVTSAAELASARIARAGVTLRHDRPHDIYVSGAGKTPALLAEAIEAEATVAVASALELRRLAIAAETAGVRVSTTLRVNRAREAAFAPYGFDEAALGGVIELAWHHPAVRLVGFSLPTVLGGLDPASLRETMQWSQATADRLGIPLRVVALAAADRPDDEDGPAASGWGAPDGVRLVVELGSAVVQTASWYGAEVLDLWPGQPGQWFAVLPSGPAPAAAPLAVLPVDDWPYPYERPTVRDGVVHLVTTGTLTTTAPAGERGWPVERLRVGDLLVFSGSAAGVAAPVADDPLPCLVTG